MPKQGQRTTRTSQLVTSDLGKDEIAFGELLLSGLSKRKAAAQVWPKIVAGSAKAKRVFEKSAFQRWYLARKEITYQTIREIAAKHHADYESRIEALAEAFSDPETKWREKLQIHDKLTVAEGRKTSTPAKGAGSVNLYALAFPEAATDDLGQVHTGGRLPNLRRALSVDTDEGRWPAAVEVVAPPAADVAGQVGPETARRVPVETVPEG